MQRPNRYFSDILRKAADDPEVALIFLKELWPQLVGAELSRKCSPHLLKKKTLIVRVADAVWEKQLQEPDFVEIILSKVNSFWERRLIERISPQLHPSKKK